MTKEQIVEATLATSLREVGVREIGNTNRGRKVDEYQRADTLPGEGYAWCSSLQAWKMLTTLGRDLCDQVWCRSASCDKVLQWARARGIVSSKPRKGAMGLVMASHWDATHIFDVQKVLSASCITVEGNTNTDGSRNGNGVYRRERKFHSRYLYIHWMDLLPAGVTLGRRIEPGPVVMPKTPFEGCPLLKLVSPDGKVMFDKVPLKDGRTWVPAYMWAQWMKTSLEWQAATQSVKIAGREVATQPIVFNDRSWLPLSKLTAHHGLGLNYDGPAGQVELIRSKAVFIK